jgi:hypothetical protein
MIRCDTSAAGAAQTAHAMSVAAPAVLSHQPHLPTRRAQGRKAVKWVGKTALLVLPGRAG